MAETTATSPATDTEALTAATATSMTMATTKARVTATTKATATATTARSHQPRDYRSRLLLLLHWREGEGRDTHGQRVSVERGVSHGFGYGFGHGHGHDHGRALAATTFTENRN